MGIFDSIKTFFGGRNLINVVLGQRVPSSDVERFFYDWLTDEKTNRTEQWKLFLQMAKALGMADPLIAENIIACVNESINSSDQSFGKLLSDKLENSLTWPDTPTLEQQKGKAIFESEFIKVRASLINLD